MRICQVPLWGGRCVLCVCICWWRHCSRPLSSPTIMCWSGLTQWALWRLIWRWWGWRACLSSWSVHRSFTGNKESTNSVIYSLSRGLWMCLNPHTRYIITWRDCYNQTSINIQWHSVWGTFTSELTDEEARVDRYNAVRTDSTGHCFDSTVSLCNKIYHGDLISWWALLDAINRLTVSH